MIISASRRTDIPAFYAEWFMRRVRAGYCEVSNPFRARQVSRISLQPQDVEVIVFWTRNAAPILPYLDELDERGYRYYFQYTLTGYGEVFEPHAPSVGTALDTIHRLAERLGPARICWRYDPIMLSDVTSPAWHVENFSRLVQALRGNIGRVTISLLDQYRGAQARYLQLRDQDIIIENLTALSDPCLAMLRAMADIAGQCDMPIVSCAEPFDLRACGIAPGQCIDAGYIRRVFGISVSSRKDAAQRPACGCVASRDIGTYNTCVHDCVYCYATRNQQQAHAHHAAHDPASTMLCPPT